MSELPTAFYHLDDGQLHPSALTTGPWDVRFQHGGPPCALLARALERHGRADRPESETWNIARITIDLMRPIPMEPLTVTASTVRKGRSAEWLEAKLFAGERMLASANAVQLRVESVEVTEPNAVPDAPPPPPEQADSFAFPFFPSEVGYHRGVEIRFVEGEWSKGPVSVWMRSLKPLVDGEQASGLERLLLLADATNGLAPTLPIQSFTYVNPDLTIHLQRLPDSEWLGFRARSIPQPTGIGLVQGQLFDAQGEIGRCAQSLLIRARDP